MENFLDKIKREIEALQRDLMKFKREVKKQEAITKKIRNSKHLRPTEKLQTPRSPEICSRGQGQKLQGPITESDQSLKREE